MGTSAGFGLKFAQFFIRGVQFCCAALILGVYSYFLAALHNHNLRITSQVRAVEGISGAAVVYTILAMLLVCCLGGLTFFCFVAMILDLAFIGAFIYVAVANRDGAGSCDGYLDTPFGRGQSGSDVTGDSGFTALPSFHTACRLQTACLAVAIIAIFFFIFSILVEFLLARNHRKEKRFGPGPQNDYTSGSGQRKGGIFGRFFSRRQKTNTWGDNQLPEHTHPDQVSPVNNRSSYATETTAVNDGHNYAATNDNTAYKHELYGSPIGQEAGYTNAYGSRPTTQGPHYPNNASYSYDDGVYNRT